jgi:hypothetical protein
VNNTTESLVFQNGLSLCLPQMTRSICSDATLHYIDSRGDVRDLQCADFCWWWQWACAVRINALPRCNYNLHSRRTRHSSHAHHSIYSRVGGAHRSGPVHLPEKLAGAKSCQRAAVYNFTDEHSDRYNQSAKTRHLQEVSHTSVSGGQNWLRKEEQHPANRRKQYIGVANVES